MKNTEEQKKVAYHPHKFELKWQNKWKKDNLYHAEATSHKEKHYALTMLPYPSGNLHIGHWYAMVPSDARARFKKMKGYNVMFPIGYDAFGLPAENAAIKRGLHPHNWTNSNIKSMRKQLQSMGTMFDWQREIITSEPEYYHWTQWLFLQLYKNDLAYRKKTFVDWCPKCNTSLAREQVWGEDRHCERCDTPVTKKQLDQWYFRITRYAEELLDFSQLDWPKRVKILQTNWIGKSEGAQVNFETKKGEIIKVFTTRPDTIWGTTFIALAPEHPLVSKITQAEQKNKIEQYIKKSLRLSEIQREATDRERTGEFTGSFAINPVNGTSLPIWVADYVIANYGTGAVMGVPAHDQKDLAFARKNNLEIKIVIQNKNARNLDSRRLEQALEEKGTMINSGPLTGTPPNQAIKATLEYLEQNGYGNKHTDYRLHDWLISRQRYWGAPIPIIYCPSCGIVPVPEESLPVLLPDDVEWQPTGESPLKLHPSWKFTQCPRCGAKAERDTDTMDTFVCSSWYHLRYLSPHFQDGPFDPREYDYWMPVDTYTGGIEHATMHLLYTRFFHKACRDIGIVKGNEPMIQLRNQGIVLAEDSEKMSKSRGNVVSPDNLVEKYSSDIVRTYLMFFARWDQGGPWNSEGIEGTARWLRKIWNTFTEKTKFSQQELPPSNRLQRKVHQTLKSVTEDFENFQFNTIISSLMKLLETMRKTKKTGKVKREIWQESLRIYLLMLAPVAPHLAEELWTQQLGYPYSIHKQKWPEADERALRKETITIVIQINGKLRDKLSVPSDINKAEMKKKALESKAIQKWIGSKKPQRTIIVPKKLVNIVI